ncbi:MAG: single-stranded-DNA-specific exonuclease RecJ [Bacteroidales bacterium]|nr:single-stranded-DNA-specific exonuclease RecJ [Bacteroidales bacterium]MCM1416295.1 single-stranded-DNA-specific exonuclease RecJ [bacterium]MCM1424345.1 single-stranded-DNA-specific exonuclease RecJ [bacterium]
MAKWMVSAKKADFNGIAERFKIDPVIARIIRNRDVEGEEAIEKFLHGTTADLYAPSLLKDAERAADLLVEKTKEQKRIRVIGDYDIDGVCATYILTAVLERCGALADAVIPHRITDGYGLNDRLIEEAAEAGIDTILTCDNGIAALLQIALAKRKGMTVIVTDHHEVPYEVQEDGQRVETLPEADAVVDPKQNGCAYPYQGICGAVVAYKLMELYLREMRSRNLVDITSEEAEELLRELLAFAGFATVGDVMELTDENRILVKYGLRQIEQSSNPGLRALLAVNELTDKRLTAYHIGFVLGPCLNATGRLDTAARALAMFRTKDSGEALTIAGELKALNDSRKEMTLQGTQQAIEMIEGTALKEDKVLVVFLPDCHESLAGIIAGRIRERYHKPVFVLTRAEEGVKGSGRSIEAYHMYDKMSECKELYAKYGGHKMAAGVSMPEEHVETFRRFLNDHSGLEEADLVEVVHIDVPMPMSYVTPKLVRQIALLEPFGNGNPKPVFAQKGMRVQRGRILGKNGNVGKYRVADESGRAYDVMYFGDLERWNLFLAERFGESEVQALYGAGSGAIVVSMIYYPEINVYRGVESLQMVMTDYSA